MRYKTFQFFLLLLFGFAFSQTQVELKQKESIDKYSDAIDKNASVKKIQIHS